MPRQARLDSPGTLHHVIVRGIEKRNIVDDDQDRNNFVFRMGQVALQTKTIIYAWALMTNHVHILLRSGPSGLPKYMRRLLTGYAVSYNRRHQRFGHLFQNRYKSILCDEDSYFTELVRYIHLNPLRAKLVKNLAELEKYPWCGHGAVVGRFNHEWQDRDHILSWFGKREGAARGAYQKYVQEGISKGRRPELVGGGLIRSQGGWAQVISMRRRGGGEISDERILGDGEFVEKAMREAQTHLKSHYELKKKQREMDKFLQSICNRAGISVKELASGSRRGRVSRLRSHLAARMIEDYGLTLAEVARHLGVSTSGISKLMIRGGSE